MSHRTKARLLGLGVVVAGFVNVASALTPSFRDRLHLINQIVSPGGSRAAASATAMFGIGLILLGRGVMQRRRIAHRLAILLLTLSALGELAKGLDFEEAFFLCALALFLLWGKGMFMVDPEPTRWRTVARRALMLGAIDFAYGFAGLILRRSHVTPRLTIGRGFLEIGSRMVGLTGPLTLHGRFGHWFPASLTLLGALTFFALFALLLAPVAERGIVQRRERDHVRALFSRPDGDTLDPFALRPDKSYIWSTDRRAAIAYRYIRGVAVSTGPPVGDPGSFEDVFARYLATCDARGWRPAVIGVRAEHLPMYQRAGFHDLYLGDEAIIEVGTFSLEGRKIRNVRQSAAHARRSGCTVEFVREADLDPTLQRALIGISDRWRSKHPERGFSMALGWMFSGRNPECLIVVCRDGRGVPCAFIRFAPCKSGRALSLDAMRRDPGAPGGVNELLIIEAVGWARAHGCEEISLNFAAFREIIDPAAEASRMKQARGWLLRKLDPYFQLESLRAFNGKFLPRWVPRYAAYRSRADIPALALAGLSAESYLPFDKRDDIPEREPEAEEQIAGARA